MQTLNSRYNPSNSGLVAFNFAGFQWPRFVAVLPPAGQAQRLAVYKDSLCGPYYHAPKPVNFQADKGQSFYLGQDGKQGFGQPGLRWAWCDEVEGVNIRHTGWYCDEFQDGKIRGIVFTLPHSRGFLAGWSMGEGMASVVECDIYETARDAAYAADSIAENAAESQREYEESQRLEDEE